MSDLECPVRLLVARHGEAEFESPALSDQGGWLTAAGRAQSRRLAEALVDQRVARVWTSPLARAVQTAEIAAAVLGVDVVVREGLAEFRVGDHAGGPRSPDPLGTVFRAWCSGEHGTRVPGGESGSEVLARFLAVLEEIGDLHRGESVLVVSHGGVMSFALPQAAANLPAGHAWGRPLGNGAVVELAGDSGGWVASRWDGVGLLG